MKLYRVLRVRKRNNNVLNYFCTHNGLFEGGRTYIGWYLWPLFLCYQGIRGRKTKITYTWCSNYEHLYFLYSLKANDFFHNKQSLKILKFNQNCIKSSSWVSKFNVVIARLLWSCSGPTMIRQVFVNKTRRTSSNCLLKYLFFRT